MNDLLAALILYTRLPFGRIKKLPMESFSRATDYWSWTGILTGAFLASGYWCGYKLSGSFSFAALFAIIVRILVTGAFHEDGLADFFDGMGGGYNRERILEIMKDSHTGTYGVIALIIYFLSFYLSLSSLAGISPVVIWALDPLSKTFALSQIKLLPYARNVENAKVKAVYTPPSGFRFFIALIPALLSCGVLVNFTGAKILLALILPLLLMIGLIILMKKKINGYTGDCCGASFLMCELSLYWGILLIYPVL